MRWLPVLLLAVAVPVRAEAPAEERARDLYARYKRALKSPWPHGWSARLRLTHDLGDLDAHAARKALLQIARKAQTLDERIAALRGLGRIADRRAAEAAIDAAAGPQAPYLLRALGDGLARNRKPELTMWLASGALRTSRKDVQAMVLDVLAVHRIAVALPEAAELYHKHQESTAHVDVLHAAVRAIGAIGGEAGRETLVAASLHDDWRVRLAAAEMLPRTADGDALASAALRRLLQDASSSVRRMAIRRVAAAKAHAFTPDVIERLGDPRLRNRREAHVALKAMTGRDFDHDAAAWRRWWRDRAEGGAGAKRKDGYSIARYYGFGVYSDRVLFVIDTSGSMQESHPPRIEIARKQLDGVLEGFDKRGWFNLIAYSDHARAWRAGEVRATPPNKTKARAWARKTLLPSGATHLHDALELAFARNERFDTIFLLSDGQPTNGACITSLGLRTCIAVWNRYRGAAIHTIALVLPGGTDMGGLEGMERLMQDLARATGGECEVVREPPR